MKNIKVRIKEQILGSLALLNPLLWKGSNAEIHRIQPHFHLQGSCLPSGASDPVCCWSFAGATSTHYTSALSHVVHHEVSAALHSVLRCQSLPGLTKQSLTESWLDCISASKEKQLLKKKKNKTKNPSVQQAVIFRLNSNRAGCSWLLLHIWYRCWLFFKCI